jgi:hypothetical protein
VRCGGHPPHKRAGAGDRVRNYVYTSALRPQSTLHIKFPATRVCDLSEAALNLVWKAYMLVSRLKNQHVASPPRWSAVSVSHSVARSRPLVWRVTTTPHHTSPHNLLLPLSIQSAERPEIINKTELVATLVKAAKQNLPLPAV